VNILIFFIFLKHLFYIIVVCLCVCVKSSVLSYFVLLASHRNKNEIEKHSYEKLTL